MTHYWVHEYFRNQGKQIELDENGTIATRLEQSPGAYNAVLGNDIIKIMDKSVLHYIRTFDIISIAGFYDAQICIGFDISEDECTECNFPDASGAGDNEFHAVGDCKTLYH